MGDFVVVVIIIISYYYCYCYYCYYYYYYYYNIELSVVFFSVHELADCDQRERGQVICTKVTKQKTVQLNIKNERWKN